MAAPDAASAPKIIPFAALEAGDADACAAVVEAWKAGVACVVRLADRAVLRGLWKGSAAGLATADTWPLERLGGLEVGHRQHGARDFLETRAISDEVRPPLGDGVRCAFDHLERCARAALKAACGPLGAAPETLLNLLDEPGRPKLSASVLRLCRYVAPAGEPRKRVCFGAHTDTTFCTAAPCAATPGLEVLDHGTWTSPERGRDSGTDVLVFCGEFLQVLSKSFYEAAVHRVALTAGAAESVRYSAPFLLRARRDATIVPVAAVAGGPPPRLLDLPGLSMAKFHRFLELRRRKLVQEHAQSNDDFGRCVFVDIDAFLADCKARISAEIFLYFSACRASRFSRVRAVSSSLPMSSRRSRFDSAAFSRSSASCRRVCRPATPPASSRIRRRFWGLAAMSSLIWP